MLSSKIASTSEGSIASSSAAVHTFRVIPSGYSTHVTSAAAPRQPSLGSVTRVLTLVSEGRVQPKVHAPPGASSWLQRERLDCSHAFCRKCAAEAVGWPHVLIGPVSESTSGPELAAIVSCVWLGAEMCGSLDACASDWTHDLSECQCLPMIEPVESRQAPLAQRWS